jgi:hypothetical protein
MTAVRSPVGSSQAAFLIRVRRATIAALGLTQVVVLSPEVRMRRRLWLLPAFFILTAQQPPVPRGAHAYHVHGTGMGADMPPWVSQTTVRDTLIGGAPHVLLHHGSRLDGDAWRFNTWLTFNVASPDALEMRYEGNSRAGAHTCEARVRNGVIEVATSPVSKLGPFDTLVLPDAAAPWILATMQWREGMQVRLRLFRCEDSEGAEPVRMTRVNATVTSGEYARAPGGVAEAVWIVQGDANEPFSATIAKSDRMVLRWELPQGSFGTMVSEYRGTR